MVVNARLVNSRVVSRSIELAVVHSSSIKGDTVNQCQAKALVLRIRGKGEIPGTLLIKRTLIETVLVVLGLREACDHSGTRVGTTLYVIPSAVYSFVDMSII